MQYHQAELRHKMAVYGPTQLHTNKTSGRSEHKDVISDA